MKKFDSKGTALTVEMLKDAIDYALNKNYGNMYNQPVILGLEHGFIFNMTVDEWMKQTITKADCDAFPNAKAAWDIKNSKLYKVMK